MQNVACYSRGFDLFTDTGRLLLLSLCLVAPALPLSSIAQTTPDQQATAADHARSLATLKIPVLRQGANGNDATAPNAANYIEALANPYPVLPDPLFDNKRQQVQTPNHWWQVRRPELVELFDREIYGRQPASIPAISWSISDPETLVINGHEAIRHELTGKVDNQHTPGISVNLRAWLVIPADSVAPVPVVMQFIAGRFLELNMARETEPDSWQTQILDHGWGFAYLDTASVQADNGAGLTQGIIGLVNRGQPRAMDDWGVLRAWAWGASKVLDYLETDSRVDASKVGIEGHSRWGKATLVAMAYDQRFSVAYVSSSGAGGAKLHRRNWGELVENVAAPGEYHWMAGNYLKYAGPLSWDDLPVDAHMLIAMCAPRPVFISSGLVGDEWVDARGMFMATAAASPVYELLGASGLEAVDFPPVETGIMNGELAFRQHAQGHTDQPNWPYFLDFAARYWQ